MLKNKITGLYAITANKKININNIENAIKEHPITILQYRHKTNDELLKLKEAQQLKQLCITHNILFIINDDVNLCKKISADGVHLGKKDQEISVARTFLGNKYIIGASCYNDINLAIKAKKNSADYVAFGAIFKSTSKKYSKKCPLSVIQEAKKKLKIAIVGIGGINFSNKKYAITAGCDAVAMISAIFK